MTDKKPEPEPQEAEVVVDAGDPSAPVEPEMRMVPSDVRDADDYKPGAAELAVAGPEDVFRAFDKNDEIAILEEIQGNVLPTWVYSFTQDGKDLTDLSVVGINEAVRMLNREGRRIRIAKDPLPQVRRFEEDGKQLVEVMVYAEDEADGSGDWGVAVEPVRMTLRNNRGEKWDKFAFTKALNKAGRNAKKKLIPEEARQVIIATMLKDPTRVQKLKSVAAESVTDLPDPATGEEAEALRKENRELYLAIRAINPMAVTPGRYDALMTANDHALERMRAFRTWLETTLENTRKQQAGESTEEPESIPGEGDEDTGGDDAE